MIKIIFRKYFLSVIESYRTLWRIPTAGNFVAEPELYDIMLEFFSDMFKIILPVSGAGHPIAYQIDSKQGRGVNVFLFKKVF